MTSATVQANILRHVCEGAAQGVDGELVGASLVLAQDGSVVGGNGMWAPPQRTQIKNLGPDVPDLSLWIPLDGRSLADLRQRPDALVGIQIIAPPGKRVSSGTLDRQISQYRLEVIFDNATPIAVPVDTQSGLEDLPMTASRSARISIPAGTRSVRLVAFDRKGRPVREIEFDLTNSQRRDTMFTAAMADAQTEAADYKRCRTFG